MLDFKKYDVNGKLDEKSQGEYVDVYKRNLKNILFDELGKLDGTYCHYCSMFDIPGKEEI